MFDHQVIRTIIYHQLSFTQVERVQILHDSFFRLTTRLIVDDRLQVSATGMLYTLPQALALKLPTTCLEIYHIQQNSTT